MKRKRNENGNCSDRQGGGGDSGSFLTRVEHALRAPATLSNFPFNDLSDVARWIHVRVGLHDYFACAAVIFADSASATRATPRPWRALSLARFHSTEFSNHQFQSVRFSFFL